jgi:predicted nucleic acid-binding protein
MRVALDTDVVLSAFISPEGASKQVALDVLDTKFSLLLSTALLVKYESVLRRPQHLARAKATDAEVTEIVDALAGFSFDCRTTSRMLPCGKLQRLGSA